MKFELPDELMFIRNRKAVQRAWGWRQCSGWPKPVGIL